MQRNAMLVLLVSLMLAGCKGTAAGRPASASSPTHHQSNDTRAVNPYASAGQPVAYIDGQPVSLSDLRTPLLEAAGGQTLAEWVLDQKIEQELARRRLAVGPTLRDAEQQILAQRLSDDPDEAQRLVNELRDRRGLGDQRFQQLMHRSAALRLLVQPDVEVSDAAVHQAFQLVYGPRFEARLILAENLADAGKLVTRARAGESFIDLAIAHSVDASRAQGGLLPPVSPADPTFPDVVRDTLQKLDEGQVSDPIALEQGFAILKLERKIPAQPVKLDDVKERMTESVRRQVEDMLMRRMRQTIISESDIVILDPALDRSWKTYIRE